MHEVVMNLCSLGILFLRSTAVARDYESVENFTSTSVALYLIHFIDKLWDLMLNLSLILLHSRCDARQKPKLKRGLFGNEVN